MYIGTKLKNEFSVKKLYSLHYFEYSKHYSFAGEQHDFWEMLYVDMGEADIYADGNAFRITQGEAVFHKPNEWHNIRATGIAAPNLIVLSFECNSPAMVCFEKKLFKLSNDEKRILGNIIKEGRLAFSSPMGDPLTQRLVRNKNSDAGAEQMIRVLTEQLLISLRRSNMIKQKCNSLLKERFDDDIVESVVAFLKQNVGAELAFSDVVRFAQTGATTLKTLFSQRMHCGVMDYFTSLKIERAKQFIREDRYNFTQISRLLGYDSLHYFSRRFRQKTGITPTEYANSVRVIIDENAE